MGCEHEKRAREAYFHKVASNHLNLTINVRGLVIHPEYPHLGASPDGYVKFYCCGCGVIEIKCPFSCKDRSFLEAIGEKSFCLEGSEDGSYIMKQQYAYFYQVQLQTKLCDVSFCEFVIWKSDELIVCRIERDDTFLTEAIDKATNFCKYGILPELVGKWYTCIQPIEQATNSVKHHHMLQLCNHYTKLLLVHHQGDNNQEMWCYCKTEESGTMIFCENEQCPIKWFHVKCLRITNIPKTKWFCPECRRDKKTRTSKKSKSH